MPNAHPQRGLTLIELLVTIAIAAVVMGLAIPGFQAFFRSNTMANVSNEIRGSLMLAREEAIRRGRQVVVCTRTSGPGCTANGTNWSGGWMVFVDTNGNDAFDAGEPILRVSAAVPAGATLRSTFANTVRYARNGQAHADGSFVACHANQLGGARVVLVSRVASPRLGGDTNNDGIPEDATGNNITSCTP